MRMSPYSEYSEYMFVYHQLDQLLETKHNYDKNLSYPIKMSFDGETIFILYIPFRNKEHLLLFLLENGLFLIKREGEL